MRSQSKPNRKKTANPEMFYACLKAGQSAQPRRRANGCPGFVFQRHAHRFRRHFSRFNQFHHALPDQMREEI